MSAPRSTTSDNAQVFDGFVDLLKDIVTNGETVVTPEGDVVRKTPNSSTLNVIRQFLKDQHMQASPAHKGLSEVAKSARLYPFKVDEAEEGPQEATG